jgi:hypothetical protein
MKNQRRFAPTGGRHRPESAVTILRNHRSASCGLGGRDHRITHVA